MAHSNRLYESDVKNLVQLLEYEVAKDVVALAVLHYSHNLIGLARDVLQRCREAAVIERLTGGGRQ